MPSKMIEVDPNSEEEQVKNKLLEEYVMSSPERRIRDKYLSEIDELKNRKSNIETEIAYKLREAFKAKEEEIMFVKRELDKRELAINDKDNSLQFIINSNNDLVNKIKKEYADKVDALSVKEKELSDIRESLMLKMSEVETLKKQVSDMVNNALKVEEKLNADNAKLNEELVSVRLARISVDTDKERVEQLNLKIQAVYENNLKKESELSSLVSEYNDKVSSIKTQEDALLKSKKDFEKEVEEKGHEIKKSLEALAKTNSSINEKMNDLDNKEKLLNESARYSELKKRELQDSINRLEELRSKGV